MIYPTSLEPDVGCGRKASKHTAGWATSRLYLRWNQEKERSCYWTSLIVLPKSFCLDLPFFDLRSDTLGTGLFLQPSQSLSASKVWGAGIADRVANQFSLRIGDLLPLISLAGAATVGMRIGTLLPLAAHAFTATCFPGKRPSASVAHSRLPPLLKFAVWFSNVLYCYHRFSHRWARLWCRDSAFGMSPSATSNQHVQLGHSMLTVRCGIPLFLR